MTKIAVDKDLIEQAIAALFDRIGVPHFTLRQRLRAALAEPMITWAPEEMAYANVGIRWVSEDGIHGRPTDHDMREYLLRTPTARGCTCDKCKHFFYEPPAEPAVEPVGYVRMLNGEPTPDDDGCVFSYGENPYRDTYGDEEWVPVSVASPPPPAEGPEGSVCARCGGLVFDPVIQQPAPEPAAARSGVFGYLDGEVRKDMSGFYAAFGMQQPPPPAEIDTVKPMSVSLLTDDEIDVIDASMCGEREFYDVFARAIEQAVRQKAGL